MKIFWFSFEKHRHHLALWFHGTWCEFHSGTFVFLSFAIRMKSMHMESLCSQWKWNSHSPSVRRSAARRWFVYSNISKTFFFFFYFGNCLTHARIHPFAHMPSLLSSQRTCIWCLYLKLVLILSQFSNIKETICEPAHVAHRTQTTISLFVDVACSPLRCRLSIHLCHSWISCVLPKLSIYLSSPSSSPTLTVCILKNVPWISNWIFPSIRKYNAHKFSIHHNLHTADVHQYQCVPPIPTSYGHKHMAIHHFRSILVVHVLCFALFYEWKCLHGAFLCDCDSRRASNSANEISERSVVETSHVKNVNTCIDAKRCGTEFYFFLLWVGARVCVCVSNGYRIFGCNFIGITCALHGSYICGVAVVLFAHWHHVSIRITWLCCSIFSVLCGNNMSLSPSLPPPPSWVPSKTIYVYK